MSSKIFRNALLTFAFCLLPRGSALVIILPQIPQAFTPNLAPVQKYYFSRKNIQVVNSRESLSGASLTLPYTLAQPTNYELTPPDIETIATTVTVKLLSSTPGSGVIIARQGNTYYVLTARHVVESILPGEEMAVLTHDGKEHQVNTNNIQKLPDYLDLALVEFSAEEDYQVVTISSYQYPLYQTRDYELGFQDNDHKPYVFVAGWAFNNPKLVFNPGILFDNSASAISNPDILNPEKVTQDFRGYELTYTNLTSPGMSGGPVLDSNGRLIAIHGRADGKEIDENDQIIREYLVEAGLSSFRIKVGLSAGIPVQTFLNWATTQPIKAMIKIENTPPPILDSSLINNSWQPNLEVTSQDNPLYWLELGNQYWRLNRFSEAIAAFDQAIKINNQLSLSWFAKGFALGFQQEYEKAFGACARATQIQPDDYNSWRCQAGALQQLQRYDAALEALNTAMGYNGKNPADWATKGELLFALQQYPEALSAFTEARKLRSSYGLPDSRVILNNQGLILLILAQPAEALLVLRQAIALDSNYATAWNNLGWALSDLGLYEESLEAYNQAIKINPNSANTWYNRGITLYQLQLDTEAKASFEQALRIDPNYQPALEAIEQLK